jgi:hypothetical protein
MNISANNPYLHIRIITVLFDESMLTVRLSDGRTITIPYYWFPRLFHARAEQRLAYQLFGKQSTLVWDELEEAIPVEAIILGIPDQTNSARSWRKANGYGFVDEQVLELVEA